MMFNASHFSFVLMLPIISHLFIRKFSCFILYMRERKTTAWIVGTTFFSATGCTSGVPRCSSIIVRQKEGEEKKNGYKCYGFFFLVCHCSQKVKFLINIRKSSWDKHNILKHWKCREYLLLSNMLSLTWF